MAAFGQRFEITTVHLRDRGSKQAVLPRHSERSKFHFVRREPGFDRLRIQARFASWLLRLMLPTGSLDHLPRVDGVYGKNMCAVLLYAL